MNAMNASDKATSIYQSMVTQPLPPLTLRIGVAGHRELENEIAARMRHSIRSIYADINCVIGQLARTRIANSIYASQSNVIRLVSSLAEGADRLCIDPDLIPFDHEIAAIIPFAREEYENDFLPPRSVYKHPDGTVEAFRKELVRTGYDISAADNSHARLIELDGSKDQRNKAYNQCSKTLVDHIDLLIAVYDGNQLKNEGTAATVKYAQAQGIPVIHISTLAPESTKIIKSSLFDQSSEEDNYTEELLSSELARILLFTDILKDNELILERFERYGDGENLSFAPENEPDFDCTGPIKLSNDSLNPLARAFGYFKNFITNDADVTAVAKKLEFAPAPKAVLDDQKKTAFSGTGASPHRFFSAFLRADQLANYYANIHRSTFLLIYCFGALALITAAIALKFSKSEGLVLVLVVLELVMLSVIWYLYRQDHHHEYHGRWLEYRCLAEILRPLLYLNSLGKSFALFTHKNTADSLSRELLGHQSSSRHWLYIHAQTIVRWAGFSYCPLNTAYKTTTKLWINDTWLKGQIHYHIQNAAKMRVIAKKLGNWSLLLFYLTFGAVLSKLLSFLLDWHPVYLTNLFALSTAICPILATTAFAIRNHAEFDISAQRSLTMRAVLITHFKAIAKSCPDATSEDLSQRLRRVAFETIDDATEWLEIYEVKEAEPA